MAECFGELDTDFVVAFDQFCAEKIYGIEGYDQRNKIDETIYVVSYFGHLWR